MSLLQHDHDPKADAPGGGTPEEVAPAVRACPTCQAELADGQDWCLNCGQAQPGRLANLPGKRAAVTVLALTTVLVGGAVAASYAALQDGSAAPGSTQLAQVSAAEPAAPVPAPATDPAASSALPAAPTTSAPADPGGTLPDTSSTPATPTPATPTPTPSTPSSSGSSTSSGTSTSSGSTGTSGSSTDSTADTRTSTTPTETAPTAIKLDGSAAALYDPYTRNTATGDVTKTLDADPGTSFPITVAPGSGSIGAGVTVDFGKTRGIREIDLTTKTPGFKVEVYATDSDELPPDVLDTRWAHLKDVTDVGTGAGNKQIISLGSGTTKYRHVLLWFTAPPPDGLTVRVSELKLLG
ncbi:MAG TPA: hypothetical protein VK501_11620 [Baekduia sp.]|uniref:hypothetical protein n=1 Tax=Baekduia sp. TaxID=2600305 RepID=UPI002C8D22D0|nr:hypothetical protein [Baekduia sp.]HMJ34556.1 hypothetical protein [Baekduia sp.]